MIGPYVKKRFFAEWIYPNGMTFEGWTNGDRWNGWECPEFEFDEAVRYMMAQTRTAEDKPEWLLKPIAYNRKLDAFVVENEGEDGDEAWPATVILLPDGTSLKTYGIGAYCWTWYEGDPE